MKLEKEKERICDYSSELSVKLAALKRFEATAIVVNKVFPKVFLCFFYRFLIHPTLSRQFELFRAASRMQVVRQSSDLSLLNLVATTYLDKGLIFIDSVMVLVMHARVANVSSKKGKYVKGAMNGLYESDVATSLKQIQRRKKPINMSDLPHEIAVAYKKDPKRVLQHLFSAKNEQSTLRFFFDFGFTKSASTVFYSALMMHIENFECIRDCIPYLIRQLEEIYYKGTLSEELLSGFDCALQYLCVIVAPEFLELLYLPAKNGGGMSKGKDESTSTQATIIYPTVILEPTDSNGKMQLYSG